MGMPCQACWHCWLEGSHLGKALMSILPVLHTFSYYGKNSARGSFQFSSSLISLYLQPKCPGSAALGSYQWVLTCNQEEYLEPASFWSLWALLTQLTRRYLTCDPRFWFSDPSTKVIFDLYSLSSFLLNCRKRKKTHQEMLKLFFLPTRRLLE